MDKTVAKVCIHCTDHFKSVFYYNVNIIILENSFWVYRDSCLCKENLEYFENECSIGELVTIIH